MSGGTTFRPTDNILDSFHPAVRTWFERKFRAPTEAQALGWPEIFSGRDTLISAPTGSGKTLAAFLVSIDRLIREAEKEPLTDAVHILYISPLKALSNDIRRNLEDPLAEIEQVALELGYGAHGIRAALLRRRVRINCPRTCATRQNSGARPTSP